MLAGTNPRTRIKIKGAYLVGQLLKVVTSDKRDSLCT